MDSKKIEEIFLNVIQSLQKTEVKLDRNGLDPFAAVLESLVSNADFNNWKKLEETRQKQKTLLNKLGDAHEKIICTFDGWEKLKSELDVVNHKKKIVAEIKNKHNTTNSSSAFAIYQRMEKAVSGTLENYEYLKGYAAYIVAIVPNKKGVFPFSPTSNTKKIYSSIKLMELLSMI